MLLIKNLPLLFSLFIFCSQLSAVTVNSNAFRNKAIFGIEFPGQGKSYHGKEAGVLSISLQEYVTTGYRVWEVNVVTSGPALLRIYHSRSLKAGELKSALGNAASAAGVPGSSIIQTPLPAKVESMAGRGNDALDAVTSDTVFKDYPIATHAHTIEFRVASLSELLDLHAELRKHWLKEPGFFEGGQLVTDGEGPQSQMKPRNLGGTLFKIDG